MDSYILRLKFLKVSMQLSEEIIEQIENNNSKFVSFKYVDAIGHLKQVDCSAKSITTNDLYLNNDHYDLTPIKSKIFNDPFRSHNTTTILCETRPNNSLRQLINAEMQALNIQFDQNMRTEISFWIEDTNKTTGHYLYLADPLDQFANLRSDIIDCLEKIGISTTFHYHGQSLLENVIGIKGNNILDLVDNYIITRFIIANVAESYGKNINFFSDNTTNIILNFSSNRPYKAIEDDMNILSYFINKKVDIRLTFNSAKTISQDSHKICKVYINIRDFFNPYLTFCPLMLYSSHEDFSVTKFCEALSFTNKIE